MRVHRSIPFRLEVMEEKVLLSSGIRDPAAAVEIEARKALKPFIFNGKSPLMLTATYNGSLGETIYSEVAPGFREKKPFTPMGNRVKVSGSLAHPGVASSDGLPNLGGSTFQLSERQGASARDLFIIDDECLRLHDLGRNETIREGGWNLRHSRVRCRPENRIRFDVQDKQLMVANRPIRQ